MRKRDQRGKKERKVQHVYKKLSHSPPLLFLIRRHVVDDDYDYY